MKKQLVRVTLMAASCSVLAFAALASHAQSVEVNDNDAYRFNTDRSPTPTDPHPTMHFKDGDDTSSSPTGTPPPPDYAGNVAEGADFKAYPGYPKYQPGVFAEPLMLSTLWNYNGAGYNFRTDSTAYGAIFRLVPSPIWNLEFSYRHYTTSVAAATVGNYQINQSTASLDDYFAKFHYCFIGSKSFYNQLCVGGNLGNDTYPILGFNGTSILQMQSVQDIVLGANVTYQLPIGTSFVTTVAGAYNMGTGAGNSGYLTSKYNSSFTFELSGEYNMTDHNVVFAGVEYVYRKAEISGPIGAYNDTWQTTSSLFGFKIGYIYSFF